MRTAQTQLVMAPATGDVGRAIQCHGCGEIGRAAWERSPTDIFQSRPRVTQVEGNFYLHHGQIACGRCQQIYRTT